MDRHRSWLLVSAASTAIGFYPIGLAYVSAALKRAGFQVSCLDLTTVDAASEAEILRQALATSGAGIVGIGGLSADFARMRRLFDIVGAIDPSLIKVAGGGIISPDPLFMLDALDIDYGVVGEGEITSVELALALAEDRPPAGMLGLAHRAADGSPTFAGERPSNPDLDALPLPDYDGFSLAANLDRQQPGTMGCFDTFIDNPRVMPLVFSRSCPFKCTFCYHAVSKYRPRSLDSIFAEIDILVSRFGVNVLCIDDDLFAVKGDRLREFCQRIKPLGLYWSCQVRPNTVDRDLLELMRAAGCYEISYGFESMADSVLTSMKKQTKPEDVEAAAEETYRAKIDIQGNFIFGDFAEDHDSINRTMTWWSKNTRYGINLSQVAVYPGAPIFERAMAEGIIADKLAFLRQGCGVIKLNKIDDDEYRLFLNSMAVGCHAGRNPPHVRGVAHRGGWRMAIDIVCPHCGEDVHYDNLPIHDGRVICKSCFARMHLPVTLLNGRTFLKADGQELVIAAIAALAAGDLAKAEASASAACRIEPRDADAHHVVGFALLSQGRIAQALPWLQQALMLSPDHAGIHCNLSAVYLAGGWVGWAWLHARQAVRLAPAGDEASSHNLAVAEALVAGAEIIQFMPAGPPVPLGRLRAVYPQLSTGANVPQHPPLRQVGETASQLIPA